jgi:hypothetical protein
MNKPLTLALLVALLCVLVLVGAALAQSSTSYDLAWHVVGSGGVEMASATYVMEGTIGQVLVHQAGSDHYGLVGGYWYPFGSDRYTVYLPLLLRTQP